MANEVDPLLADTWTHTRPNTTKVTHKWTISNCTFYSQTKECLKSSVFSPPGNDNLKWCLYLYPNNDSTAKRKDYVGLYVSLLTSNVSEVETTVQLSLIDVNNKRKNSRTYTQQFLPNASWGYDFIEKNVLMEEAKVLLPNDKLTIFCEIDILDKTISTSGKHEPIHIDESKYQIKNDFWSLFKTHDLTDVTLTVGGKDIAAHKMILAARSPVFLALFKSDMRETKLSRVVIDDIEHEVFMEMLHFFYTDKVASIEKMAPKLLAAADKYNVEGLKAICTQALHQSLNIENAVDLLILADLHNADRLKISVVDFIRSFSKDIIDTGAFESLADAYPDLMVETLRAMRTRKNSSNSITDDVENS